MEYRFGVTPRSKAMAARLQLATQCRMVVDLAVVDDAKILIIAQHRLMSTRDVDDAEALVAQANVAIEMDSTVIRTPMAQDVPHPLDQTPIHVARRPARQRYSADAAHGSSTGAR
jgi:hypothetical protein